MKMLRNMFMVTLMVAMAACSTLGVPSPKSFNDKVAVALTTVTSVRTTATVLVTARTITPDDAQNVQDLADKARSGIDIARTLRTTVPTAADQRLEASLVMLQELQKYLNARKGVTP